MVDLFVLRHKWIRFSTISDCTHTHLIGYRTFVALHLFICDGANIQKRAHTVFRLVESIQRICVMVVYAVIPILVHTLHRSPSAGEIEFVDTVIVRNTTAYIFPNTEQQLYNIRSNVYVFAYRLFCSMLRQPQTYRHRRCTRFEIEVHLDFILFFF